MSTTTHRGARTAAIIGAVALLGAIAAGCGGSSAPSASPTASNSTSTAPPAGAGNVLPVASNPIANTATTPGLQITKALVENNVSPETGKPADDHLEVTVSNTSATAVDTVEMYYKITDPTKNATEGYYTKLTGFTIAPGATRIAHFDNASGPDHYPVNKYSLYYTDKNALVIDITASATGLKPATFSVKKDAGGAEKGVE